MQRNLYNIIFAFTNDTIISYIIFFALTLSKLIAAETFIKYQNLIIRIPGLAISSSMIINKVFIIWSCNKLFWS